ncbi:uncharacterized protein LOC105200126 [Solenopsis invicta]|uniref:uncharacterized protein LOC105200126 n=1 Tax=Solenopsis invicta TaxID=13686 RepID=UPI0001FED3D6|nr:uncharacterized protein LOC105200126 [Solenopsis invicta]
MKLTIALLMVIAVVMSTTVMAEDGEEAHEEGQGDYVHLPGKSCDDAPPCPDGRPCIMAPPHCNSGTCGTDPVPQCGEKPA